MSTHLSEDQQLAKIKTAIDRRRCNALRKFATRGYNFAAQNSAALIHAVARDNGFELDIGIIKFLIENGCNPRVENDVVMYHIIRLMNYFGSNVEILLEYLVEKGCNINNQNGRFLLTAIESENWVAFFFLVNSGCNVRCQNDEALRLTCMKGRLDAVKCLVDRGCNPRINNDELLIIAIKHDITTDTMFKYLVEQGCDIGCQNNLPLMTAAEYDHNFAIEHMIEKKYNVRVENDRALHVAISRGSNIAALSLAEAGYDHVGLLMFLVRTGRVDWLRDLFDGEWSLTAFDSMRQTITPRVQDDAALVLAAENGHVDVMKFLVEHGCDLKKHGQQLFQIAIEKNYANVRAYLIAMGC
jgi:ankyrin repeat protein